jgi:hypothetical protein
MSFAVERLSARVGFGLLTLALILILLLLALLAPPDGNERTEWLQFLGHFHPIAVHLPIAILIVVPLVELAGASLAAEVTPVRSSPSTCGAAYWWPSQFGSAGCCAGAAHRR